MSERIFWLQFSGLNTGGSEVSFEYATSGVYNATVFTEGRLAIGEVRTTMFSGNALRGALQISEVTVNLSNDDGFLDSLDAYSFDGSGAYLNTYPNHDNLVELTLEQPVFDEKAVVFAGRDYRHKFDKPLLTNRYAGTNAGAPLAGIEGTANDIKGQPKPRVLGTVFNITPVQVNTDRRIYQVDGHDGLTTGWTMTVYDKRSALVAGAVYVSQADMEANVPAAGQYRVWPAGGCFRIGSAPVGQVTCDVTNPPHDPANAGPAYAPSSSNSLLSVARWLAYLGDTNLTSFVTGEAKQYWTNNPAAGVYCADDVSILTQLEEVLGSVNSYMLRGLAPVAPLDFGTFFLQLTAPTSLPYTPQLAAIELDFDTIIPESLQQLIPDDAERGLPVWRVNLNYKRNYTVMGEADLAGVAAADKEFCKREYRTVTSSDAAVLTQWPNAIDLTVNTLLTVQSDAQAEADRLLALLKVRRRMFQLKVSGEAIRLQAQFTAVGATVRPECFQIGSVVRITYPRFGLNAGVSFLVTSMGLDAMADVYNLTVWG